MPIVNGEVPSSLPPSGTAGGGLTGTFPSPALLLNSLKPTAALYETYPRWTISLFNQSTLTSQTVFLQAIALPLGVVVASVSFVSGTQALVSGNHQLFGLYSSALALRATSADDTSTAWTANTLKTLAMTAPYTTTTAGLHYLAILVDAGTVPSLIGSNATSAVTGLAPVMSGNSNATVTALPSTASAISPQARQVWGYVS